MWKLRELWQRLPSWLEFSIIGAVAVAFLVLGGAILWATVIPIPAINNFENRQVAQSTKIYDRTGNIVLFDVHGAMRRTAVPLDQISPYLRNATIATEDATFYQNAGFRPLSFLRAAVVNITTGHFTQGGSTITQQVVKNALLSQNKTIARKIEEIILALRLTKVYTKDQILSAYLNENPYGGTIYGAQEASQYFFGVDAIDLDLAQAAYLAALPQAPTYYSPYGNHRAALDNRKNLVLKRMLDNKLITPAEYEGAKAEQVEFRSEAEAGIKAPHFVFFVREYLEEKYGVDAVASGGLKVITTLDYDLQKKAEAVVAEDIPGMEKNFNASNTGVVVLDPKTGQILAMVGSRGYFDPDIDGKVNVTLTNRQPGSSFKPFVYAAAFAKGYTPDTVVFDLPTQFSTACAPSDVTNDTPPCYSPSNFDGTFKGPMTLRNAIAQSENVPSVKTLYLAGIQNAIDTAVAMGITTLSNAARYGLTLVLGGGEVNLLEETSAYGVFANDGVRNPPTGILSVEDNAGNVLEKYQNESTRVLDPQVARQINDVLSDNVARTPEFGADSPLYFGDTPVADKTGTTNDFRDVWILGYTPGVVVGAWAGNNDNSAMEKKIAAFIIAPMWHKIMAQAIEKYPSDTFPPPAPDPAYDSLPPVLRGNWNTDPSQGLHDILYWVNKANPRAPGSSANDPQLAYWDYPVRLWAQQNPNAAPPGQPVAAPASQPQSQQPAPQASSFQITSPRAGEVFSVGATVSIGISNQGQQAISSVLYYVNGVLVGTSAQAPYSINFTPATRGAAHLRVTIVHPDGSNESQTLSFTIQ